MHSPEDYRAVTILYNVGREPTLPVILRSVLLENSKDSVAMHVDTFISGYDNQYSRKTDILRRKLHLKGRVN